MSAIRDVLLENVAKTSVHSSTCWHQHGDRPAKIGFLVLETAACCVLMLLLAISLAGLALGSSFHSAERSNW